ncbi:MAG: tyrosine--tRNA ligase [Bacteroidales bacterium]
MANQLIEELRWRGMIHDIMPGTDEQLSKEMTTAYVGFDPTADSLHIGHLVSIMLLKHLQKAGHKPIALIGGATGMIGDPSGKSEERKLLDEATLKKNQESLYQQLSLFLDFREDIQNKAEIVNNYDWIKSFDLISFLREVGKHITVNYMLSKDSVKKRMETGISFTEFTYQLLQGYDFLYLYEHYNCKLQMGGSDQWGNITTGTELIRRKLGGEAFALTCPLITKADGGKFGKTEKGNIWLDKRYTSPYQFYQFWINTSDEDAERYIKIFTMLSREEIEAIISNHKQKPHLRILQHALAKEVTIMVHGIEEYKAAFDASQILFGKGTKETLEKLDEQTFLSVFEGVPQYSISKEKLISGISILDLLAVYTNIFNSKSEARKLIAAGGLSINKDKINSEIIINTSYLLNDKFILVQKGKKNYYIIVVKD